MGDETFSFPTCNAWDVSALLSMSVQTDIPEGETWAEFCVSVHQCALSVMCEAQRMASVIPYRTIPHPSPGALMTSAVAMKAQYTLDGKWCNVRVGVSSHRNSPVGTRLGVFATENLRTGHVVTTVPVDAIFLHYDDGFVISQNNDRVDPSTFCTRKTLYENVSVMSSCLYFCPERCGHMIQWNPCHNAAIVDMFGGVMYVVKLTRDVSDGEELFIKPPQLS